MDLSKIYLEVDNIEKDRDKVIHLSNIISYVKDLKNQIGFKEAEINYINIINKNIKNEIDKHLNDIIKQLENEIDFLLYYNNNRKSINNIIKNNETKPNNRDNRTFKFG